MTSNDLKMKFHLETGNHFEKHPSSVYIEWLEQELINRIELEEAVQEFQNSSNFGSNE